MGQEIPRVARDFGRGLALRSRPHSASSFADADREGKAENEKFRWLLGRINPEGVQVARLTGAYAVEDLIATETLPLPLK